MKNWLSGKRGGLMGFAVIALLVAGGLGWVTAAALRLEHEQLEARAEAELHAKLRLALWRLDSFMIPELAREASRPFAHYSAVYIPSAFDRTGMSCAPGSVLELSPLLTTDLPPWILLHFSTATEAGWWSPQVLSVDLRKRIRKVLVVPQEDDAHRAKLLAELSKNVQPKTLLRLVRLQEQKTQNPGALPQELADNVKNLPVTQQVPYQQSYNEFQNRAGRFDFPDNANSVKQPVSLNNKNLFWGNLSPNGESLLKPGKPAKTPVQTVTPGPMTAFWIDSADGNERLLVARGVQVGPKQVCQGIVLDWNVLKDLLAGELADLFPKAMLRPMRASTPAHPERAMTALPVELEVASASILDPGWNPLRVGLALAWAAALVALGAVVLGGWALLNLSERRIRFVSTVTHELRTPLTTLRLYLDMLTGGMIKDEKQKDEYLHTLNAETDRLHRLVSNVLDFSRLEDQRPRLEKMTVEVADLLDQLRGTWQMRCKDACKDLIIEDGTGAGAALVTDVQMVQQVLGNLIDNACKYSRSAEDARLWLRASRVGDRFVFEVEDRGPGVPAKERRSIFRAFRRGKQADVTAGGVGLGLALAQRWASLLGGNLTLCSARASGGACFRLELPR